MSLFIRMCLVVVISIWNHGVLKDFGRINKGNLKRGVRCERFDRTLSVVLKSLSQGFYRTFLGAQKGVRQNLSRGSIEPSGGFDRTFLGRSPISGYRFKLPSKIAVLKTQQCQIRRPQKICFSSIFCGTRGRFCNLHFTIGKRCNQGHCGSNP